MLGSGPELQIRVRPFEGGFGPSSAEHRPDPGNDPGGAYVRTIGRRGPGPGELSGGATLCILLSSSGDLVLPDVVIESFVVFSTDETHQGNLRFDTRETIPRWRRLSGDTLMVVVQGKQYDSFVRRKLEGEWRDTVVVMEAPARGASPIDGRWTILGDKILWSVTGANRVVISRMTQPSVALFKGVTLNRVIRWTPRDVRLSEADQNTLLGIAAKVMGDGNGNPESARSQMATPEQPPMMANVEAGPGFVLVQRLRPFEEMDRRILSTFRVSGLGESLWDVFSWSGDYLGVLDFGDNVEVFRIRGDTVVGIREDSLAVVHPFIGRIPKGLIRRIGTY